MDSFKILTTLGTPGHVAWSCFRTVTAYRLWSLAEHMIQRRLQAHCPVNSVREPVNLALTVAW